jgi:hypothetical protein
VSEQESIVQFDEVANGFHDLEGVGVLRTTLFGVPCGWLWLWLCCCVVVLFFFVRLDTSFLCFHPRSLTSSFGFASRALPH